MGGSMSFCGMSGLDRSSLTRLFFFAVVPIALMITSTGARAQDCFTAGDCTGGNGADGQSVTANADSVTAIGGAGGAGGNAFVIAPFYGTGGDGGAAIAYGTTSATAIGGAGGASGNYLYNGQYGLGGNGADATATSRAISNGSSNATSTATAIGGARGEGISYGSGVYGGYGGGAGGDATATSSATANGSGNAISSATATGGAANGSSDFGFAETGNATATAYAETAEGGLAQAQAQADGNLDTLDSQSTAKTTFGGVSVQSIVESPGGSTNAIAQGGSGQFPANPEQSAFVFSTALPNTAQPL
jgi:hypothetical protein